ncbi:hypothetical protein BS78_08G171300 [Paspalum vaginatum]|nr:hypothetical protein BS78_08G171300 [Paspalum vaginatum]KAJ1266688.1 hypothetical protein BS78_08G171300 [Paspalum vaginatum]KAJ1266689.1 hypothetical protein BS78_08G171300 [Paspalum vaginatum]KAJ1266690.1 hypothetical protein BS78_08G171300 [Paspalum vaginatum]
MAARRPRQKHRLYLILDDDLVGYSIREISLSPPTCRLTRSSRDGKGSAVRRLPHPIFYLEAQRGLPLTFAAIGTKILTTQCLNPVGGGDFGGSDLVIPIYDVRRRAVTFAPGKLCNDCPIYIPVGDNLFDLQTGSLSKLSFEPKQPPSLDYRQLVPWSWQELSAPPFDRVDVNSYTVHPDGHTILVSTDTYPGDPHSAAGTFTFDTRKGEWKTHGDWSLPFTGRAYFLHSLEAFVGLSKDPATLGHLASCGCEAITHPAAACKLGKEKLFSDDPAEAHVSARLVYTGRGGSSSDFCLVQCGSVKPGNGNADDDKNPEEPCYRYRLTTFSLSYDDYNGDLTTGETSSVQCYEVPRNATPKFIDGGDPVAFWL